jgi:hypothetical protein
VNASKIVKNLCLAPLLASFVAPALGGCAVQEGAEPDAPPVAVQVSAPAVQEEAQESGPQAALGATANFPDAILEQMAKSLTEAIFGSAIDGLFPQRGIDVEKLLANIDAQTRQAIFEQVLGNNKAFLDASMSKLKDYEIAKGQVGKPDTKSAQEIYRDMVGDSTLNNTELAIAQLGPEGTSRFKREGLSLFIQASQIDANRKMLQIQLRPDAKGTDVPILVAHLREHARHIRQVVAQARSGEVDTRLWKITPCNYKAWDDMGMTRRESYFSDDAIGAKFLGDVTNGPDRMTNIARCDAVRDIYWSIAEARIMREQDGKFAFALRMAEEWTRAADALESKSGAQSTVYQGLDFGGMYGAGWVSGGAKSFVNPFTGAASCPAGYTATKFAGQANVDYDAFVCTRPANGVAEPIADFGGMFGTIDHREGVRAIVNAFTNESSCPTGFSTFKVLGDDGSDNDLSYCARPHVAGTKTPFKFGGLYSRMAGHKNVVTDAFTCDEGMTATTVWGSNGNNGTRIDRAVVMCSANQSGLTPIFEGVFPASGDHVQGPVAGEGAPGYQPQGVSFQARTQASSSTKPLYRCAHSGGRFHFLSNDARCEGYTVEYEGKPIGHLDATQTPGTEPVYRCTVPSGEVHISLRGENTCATKGMTREMLQGYAAP